MNATDTVATLLGVRRLHVTSGLAGPIPKRKKLVVADYSALEVVILADLCKRLFGDTQLEAMVDPKAPDIHGENAKKVFGFYLGWKVPEFVKQEGVLVPCPDAGKRVDEIPSADFKKSKVKNPDGTVTEFPPRNPYGAVLRDMIKTVWYGLQYGKGAYGFSTLEGADGRPIGEDVAQEMLDSIEKTVPAIFEWQAWVRKWAKRRGGIYSLGGRWCPLAEEMSAKAPEWLRNRGFRRAYNFPVQASAAELIGDAMCRLGNDKEFLELAVIMLQVHDELVCRSDDDDPVVKRVGELMKLHMESATCNGTPLIIPVRVSVGSGYNYYEAK
jgi:DNA polymerase I-like protein with 3'-5' exonuclease and polymerase domains